MGSKEDKAFFTDYQRKVAKWLDSTGAEDSPWYPLADCTECTWAVDQGLVHLMEVDGQFELVAQYDKVYRGDQASLILVSRAPIGGRRILVLNTLEVGK